MFDKIKTLDYKNNSVNKLLYELLSTEIEGVNYGIYNVEITPYSNEIMNEPTLVSYWQFSQDEQLANIVFTSSNGSLSLQSIILQSDFSNQQNLEYLIKISDGGGGISRKAGNVNKLKGTAADG